jgi:hypothetical protein
VLELSLSELFGFFRTFGEVGERLVELAISPVSGTLEDAQRELVEAGAAVHLCISVEARQIPNCDQDTARVVTLSIGVVSAQAEAEESPQDMLDMVLFRAGPSLRIKRSNNFKKAPDLNSRGRNPLPPANEDSAEYKAGFRPAKKASRAMGKRLIGIVAGQTPRNKPWAAVMRSKL